jgi:hypothetical protein
VNRFESLSKARKDWSTSKDARDRDHNPQLLEGMTTEPSKLDGVCVVE